MSGDFWSNRSVLVTGAGGFVGSWLAKALVEAGARVTCILRDRPKFSNFRLFELDEVVDIVWVDLTDYINVERILNEYEIEICFHLAAQAIVGVANSNPLSTFESNIRGTYHLLEACRRCSTVQAMIVASSDKAYGDQEQLPYREEFPLNGLYPYDASKACVDILARCYYHTYKLPVAVTRMANTYGGGDFNFSRLIPGTIRYILKDEDPIIRSDGTPERDYLYISDAVDGYLKLAERLLEDSGMAGQAFNFGTGLPVSVIDLVNMLIRLSGNDIVSPRIMSPTKIHGEIDRQYMDSSKANQILGWQAKTRLEEGLRKTIDWYRDHFDLIE